MPHIDDLVAFPQDIDKKQSIKKLLEQAETALHQSEASRDFNRPATAFKAYIKAYIIVAQVIKDHRDYSTLARDGSSLGKIHSVLLKRISQQSDAYEQIKRDIIADNRRTGVLPSSGIKPSDRSSTNGQISHQRSDSATKAKPAVQPKPQSLQGNSISKHGRSASSSVGNQDLAARFANLRGPQASVGQDPRIKTHSMQPLKPAGPREMPTTSKPASENAPGLPKMPDAIYTPTRVNSFGDAPRAPAAGRAPMARHGSSASVSSPVNTSYGSEGPDYLASKRSPPLPSGQTPSLNGSVASDPPKRPMKIPIHDSITPEELFDLMKQKGSLLIIDIRTRDDFNEGHIMSSSVICVEPNILLREDLSADDISESLVLSPAPEQALFDRRSQYDLVVFYDQDSYSIPQSPRSSEDLVIVSLHRALVHLSYGRELKTQPKILKGGLDAWVDLVGTAALQVSLSPNERSSQVNGQRKAPFQRRQSKYLARPLRPEEARVWKEALQQNEEMNAQSPTLHRSTESFLRRYPPVLSERESMSSSSSSVSTQPKYGTSHKHDLTSDMPSPPARPAPAVPRTYSSLSRTTSHTDEYEASQPEVSQRQEVAKYHTGLNNPHNWCYANSTLQSLLASPDFGTDLANSTWKSQYKAPRKPNEPGEHPQIMVNFISNFFHWMRSGKFPVMKAQFLMGYSQDVCKRNHSSAQFGGTQQQDAQEFMSFVMEHIHDETNSRRDHQGNPAQPKTSQPLIMAAAEYWRNHLQYNQSIIDRYWRGLELSTVDCSQCHTKTYTYSPFEWIPAPVNTSRVHTLEQALQQHISNNTLDDFSCDKCRCKTKAVQSISFARLPPLLCVCFRRFNYNQSTGDIRKSTALITWDFNDFDFSPYFLDGGVSSAPPPSPGASPSPFEGPFKYECYAVIVHAGSRTDNGHYFAYVRDSSTHDPYAWLKCDDSRVTKCRIGSGDRDDVQGEVFKSGQDRVPYLVFFRRKGGGSGSVP